MADGRGRRRRWAVGLLAAGAWLALGPAAGRAQGATATTELQGVACAGPTACYAVGEVVEPTSTSGLVLRWNGRLWSRVALVTVPGVPFVVLRGVACPTATRCYAAGYTEDRAGTHALLVSGSGARWSPMRGAAAGAAAQLVAVACGAPASCLAVGMRTGVGGAEGPLAERWNGRAWQLGSPPPVPGAAWSRLLAVACASPERCAVLGAYQGGPAAGGAAILEGWSGGRWAPERVGRPIAAVACPPAGACLALGQARPAAAGLVTMASAPAGWRLVGAGRSPAASGFGADAMACPAANRCLAVGSRPVGTGGNEMPAAAGWSGRSWVALRTPGPIGPDSGLDGLACPSALVCVAVGVAERNGTETGIAEQWDGSTWRWRPIGTG